jgi:hypothetical protein
MAVRVLLNCMREGDKIGGGASSPVDWKRCASEDIARVVDL